MSKSLVVPGSSSSSPFAVAEVDADILREWLGLIEQAKALKERWPDFAGIEFFNTDVGWYDSSPFSGAVDIDSIGKPTLVDELPSYGTEGAGVDITFLVAFSDGIYWRGYLGYSDGLVETEIVLESDLRAMLAELEAER